MLVVRLAPICGGDSRCCHVATFKRLSHMQHKQQQREARRLASALASPGGQAEMQLGDACAPRFNT